MPPSAVSAAATSDGPSSLMLSLVCSGRAWGLSARSNGRARAGCATRKTLAPGEPRVEDGGRGGVLEHHEHTVWEGALLGELAAEDAEGGLDASVVLGLDDS